VCRKLVVPYFDLFDSRRRQIMKQFPDKVIEIAFNDEFAGIDVDTPEKYKQLFPKE